MKEEQNERFMTLVEVAQFFNMTERTIYMWAQQGTIPAYKIGNSWRFRRSILEKWLEGRTNTNTTVAPHTDSADPVAQCAEGMERTWRESSQSLWAIQDFMVPFIERYGRNHAEQALAQLEKTQVITIVEQEVTPNRVVRFLSTATKE